MISGINATTSNLPIFFISFESIINLSYVKWMNKWFLVGIKLNDSIT